MEKCGVYGGLIARSSTPAWDWCVVHWEIEVKRTPHEVVALRVKFSLLAKTNDSNYINHATTNSLYTNKSIQTKHETSPVPVIFHLQINIFMTA